MMSSMTIRKLRPFVTICQIVGLVPFSMKMDPKNGGFIEFDYSIKNFVSWWYIFVSIVQTVNFFFTISLGIFISKPSVTLTAVTILLKATQFLYAIQILLTKIAPIRYKRFRRIVNLIMEVEQHLSTILPQSIINRDTIVSRTVIGIMVFVFMTILSATTVWSILDTITVLSNDSIGAIFIIAFQSVLYFMLTLGILMLHLAYYIISHQFELLITSIKLNKGSKSIISEIQKMKTRRYIFDCLCRAAIQLNHIFSFPALVAISSKLITTVYAIFSIIQQLRNPNPLLARTTFFNGAGLLGDVLVIIIFFTAADMPIRQARLLKEQIIISSNNAKIQQDAAEFKIEVMCFLMQIEEDRIRLSGSGLFQAGMHLVPSLVATIITYLVILLQTQ